MFYAGLFAALLVVALLTLVAALHRRKARSEGGPLFSAAGIVTSQLNPTGSVMVRGELFFAESIQGELIPDSSKVTIVGARNHVLLVTPAVSFSATSASPR